MTLNLINQSSIRMPKAYLSAWVKYVTRYLRHKKIGEDFFKKELTIVFVDKQEAQKMNKHFRFKNYATDVLSFSGDWGSLGELVICPQVIQKQAVEHQLSFRDEAAYMVLHGILHLLGFDHEIGGDAAREMYELQDRIFENISKIS